MGFEKIKNEKRDITTNIREIQKNHENTMNCYMLKKLYNLEEMNKFLEITTFRLNQEEIHNLNRLITSSEIEFVIK